MGGFEAAGATAQDEGEHPGPWLWQGGQWGAAAGEGGRRLNRLEGTSSRLRSACSPGTCTRRASSRRPSRTASRLRGGPCVVGRAWWAARGGPCVVGRAWWAVRGGPRVVGRAWWAARVASRAPKRCSISRRDRDLATISRRAACWLRLAYSLRTQTPTQQPTSAPSEKMSVRSSMVESLGTSKSSGARYLYAG